jgi:membrane-bound lytic murein transglycosylase MltF
MATPPPYFPRGKQRDFGEKGFAFAVAPDEEELWKSLEEFLAALEKAGVLEELRRRYLG